MYFQFSQHRDRKKERGFKGILCQSSSVMMPEKFLVLTLFRLSITVESPSMDWVAEW